MRTTLRKFVATMGVMALSCGILTGVSLVGSGAAGAAGSGGASAPIKIGLVCSCTGPLGGAAIDIPTVYKAWADSVNASGGINGHKIDVIYKDDTSNPATSTTIVHNFVETDHVIAVLDATNNDAAWDTYLQQQKIPAVGMDTSTEPFYLNSDFYAEGQTEDSLFSGIIQAVKQAAGSSPSSRCSTAQRLSSARKASLRSRLQPRVRANRWCRRWKYRPALPVMQLNASPPSRRERR